MEKPIRDNIDGITKGSIKQMARKAGIKTISSLSYEEVKGRIKMMLEEWLYKIATYTEHNRKTTVGIKEVSASIPHKYYSKFLNEKKCKNKKSSPSKEVEYYQNLEGCLSIRKKPFERLVKEIAQEYSARLRFSANAIIMIQHCLENCVVEMLTKANLSAIHAGRVTVYPKDMQLSMKLSDTNKCGNGAISAGAPLINYSRYIRRVLKEVNPKKRMSKNALYQINQLLNLLGKAIVEKAQFLNSKEIKAREKKTISQREIQSAIRLILPPNLSKYAVTFGSKSLLKFTNVLNDDKSRKTLQEKAGLKFPVTRTAKFFKKYNTRVSSTASVYLASVLEYVTAELLSLVKKVSSRELKLAIDNDDELKNLCKTVCFDIADGGVIPQYNPMDDDVDINDDD